MTKEEKDELIIKKAIEYAERTLEKELHGSWVFFQQVDVFVQLINLKEVQELIDDFICHATKTVLSAYSEKGL